MHPKYTATSFVASAMATPLVTFAANGSPDVPLNIFEDNTEQIVNTFLKHTMSFEMRAQSIHIDCLHVFCDGHLTQDPKAKYCKLSFLFMSSHEMW